MEIFAILVVLLPVAAFIMFAVLSPSEEELRAKQEKTEVEKLKRSAERDERYREIGKQTRKAAGSAKGAAKGTGRWISDHSRHPIMLILITFALVVGGYYLISPYQNCVRQADKRDMEREGEFTNDEKRWNRTGCNKSTGW